MDIENTLKLLPESPGVYQYFASDGELIYVGKAKNLKRRVSSYFNKNQGGKVLALVRRIDRLEYIVVSSEFDALLLENNLIKKYKPHYNILLKDDKTYPWLCLSKEEYPRLYSTRRIVDGAGSYFGPYASPKIMHTMLDMIHDMFPLRNCNLKLSGKTILDGKFRLCLEYQMKRCAGVCAGEQSKEDYLRDIEQIKNILKGHIKPVLQELKIKMLECAKAYDFKQAQAYKEKFLLLEKYKAKSTIISDKDCDYDVLSCKEDVKSIFFNYMRVVDGAIVSAQSREIKRNLDEESLSEILLSVLIDFREKFSSSAKDIILPFDPKWNLEGFNIFIPKLGDKKELLDLSLKNIDFFILEKNRRQDLLDPNRRKTDMLRSMQDILKMDCLPNRIECFDNSNLLGNYPVSAMTVSVGGKLSKKDYRHFNIETVVGPNDYASMEEVFERRYTRLINENGILPNLIIVDGGKGQLSSAFKILSKLGLEKKIKLIGIAERLEEIYTVGDPYPLLIDKRSEVLKHIQQLRDEAHRFGITHYRKRHVKALVSSELGEIEGIGKATEEKLLKTFKSVKKISALPLGSLAEVIGEAKANIVWQYFRDKKC